MLIRTRALAQQNLDQNTVSRTLGTLGAVVCCDCCDEMHRPGPWPQVTLHTDSEPRGLRWLTEDTFPRGIWLCTSVVSVHHVRLQS